jgi:HAD superfamily hydrolase (TIGR01509 family)
LTAQRGRIEAVIFDLDGVLVDSEPAHQAASRRLVAPAELSDEDYRRFVGSSLEAFMNWVREHYALEAPVEDIAARYDVLVAEEVIAAQLPPLDGAIELLDALRAREMPLAVASQSLPAWVAGALSGARLESYFDRIVAADAVRRPKPEADIYLHTARLLGIEPARCLVIEDSVPGVRAGLAAGMTVVQSRQSSMALPPQPGAHHVIESLRDFDLGWLHPAL